MADVTVINVPSGKRVRCKSSSNTTYSTSYTFRWPDKVFQPGVTITDSADGGTSLNIDAYADEKEWQVYGSYRPGVGWKAMKMSATPTDDDLNWKLEFWHGNITGDAHLTVDVRIID